MFQPGLLLPNKWACLPRVNYHCVINNCIIRRARSCRPYLGKASVCLTERFACVKAAALGPKIAYLVSSSKLRIICYWTLLANKAQQTAPQRKNRQEALVVNGLVTIVIPMDFQRVVFCGKNVKFFPGVWLRAVLRLLDTSSRAFVNNKINTHSTFGLSPARKWAGEVPRGGTPLQAGGRRVQPFPPVQLWSPLSVRSQRCSYAGGHGDVLTSPVLSSLACLLRGVS